MAETLHDMLAQALVLGTGIVLAAFFAVGIFFAVSLLFVPLAALRKKTRHEQSANERGQREDGERS